MGTTKYILGVLCLFGFHAIALAQQVLDISDITSFQHGVVITTTHTRDTIYQVPADYMSIQSPDKQKDKSQTTLTCHTSDPVTLTPPKQVPNKNNTTPVLNIYYELDHATYLSLGSDLNTCIAWLNHQYAQVAEIYAMYNIQLQISEIFIWDTPDIYTNQSLNARLETFGARLQNNFNGDAAQLITTESIGGGKAHIDQLCRSYDPVTHKGPYGIIASMNPSTDFTEEIFWNVYVLAHELGHTVGAPHTHACLWGPNNDEPLDNCFILEGGCPPMDGESIGTVMSYCHLNAGTDLDNGFGAVVGAFIRNKLLTNPCINGDCPKNKNVLAVSATSPNETAIQTITSSASIPQGSAHTFSASETITFEPGFEVAAQATFATMLEGCLMDD